MKESTKVDVVASNDKNNTNSNRSLKPCETVAFIVLVIIVGVFLALVGFMIYQQEYVVPARMEADFYQHYWYEDGCDDHTTLTCVVGDTFSIHIGKLLHHDDVSFLNLYCIPQCEMAYRHPFPTTASWKGACTKTPYNYLLFNRTQYESMALLPETLRKPAGPPAAPDAPSVAYDEL